MTQKAVVDTSALTKRRGARGQMKGRTLDPQALADVQALLGDSPRRPDLLIEFLHRIQDRYGYISAANIVALAQNIGASQVLFGSDYPHPEGLAEPSDFADAIADAPAGDILPDGGGKFVVRGFTR